MPHLKLKPWRLSHHRTLRLKLNHLFPFYKMEDNVEHSPDCSSALSSGKKTDKWRKRFPDLLLILRCPKLESSKIDNTGELPKFSRLSEKVYPSPMTPAYMESMATRRGGNGGGLEEVDDDNDENACQDFERYVMEMIVDGRRIEDLNDVEELLCCWQDLKCPVYMDLVCRF
ncbi:unnamed protein product [Victoria cruziana]